MRIVVIWDEVINEKSLFQILPNPKQRKQTKSDDGDEAKIMYQRI